MTAISNLAFWIFFCSTRLLPGLPNPRLSVSNFSVTLKKIYIYCLSSLHESNQIKSNLICIAQIHKHWLWLPSKGVTFCTDATPSNLDHKNTEKTEKPQREKGGVLCSSIIDHNSAWIEWWILPKTEESTTSWRHPDADDEASNHYTPVCTFPPRPPHISPPIPTKILSAFPHSLFTPGSFIPSLPLFPVTSLVPRFLGIHWGWEDKAKFFLIISAL